MSIKAFGIEPAQPGVSLAEAELAEANMRIAKLEARIAELEQRDEWQQTSDAYVRAERAERQAAALTYALEAARTGFELELPGQWPERFNDLITDFRKDFVPKAELEAVQRQAAAMREALESLLRSATAPNDDGSAFDGDCSHARALLKDSDAGRDFVPRAELEEALSGEHGEVQRREIAEKERDEARAALEECRAALRGWRSLPRDPTCGQVRPLALDDSPLSAELERARAERDTARAALEGIQLETVRSLGMRDMRERCARLVEGRNTGCDGTDACAANRAAAIRALTLEDE